MLQLIAALGIVTLTTIISNISTITVWVMRFTAAAVVVHCGYSVLHHWRSPNSRTPGSSAAYQFFSGAFDIATLCMYSVGGMATRNQSGEWETLVYNRELLPKYFIPALYYTFIAAGALHMLSLTLSLYLCLVFRRIANMPPDMNPLEDRFTARSGPRHWRNKSSVSTWSALSSPTKAPLIPSTGRSIPFMQTRGRTSVFGNTRPSQDFSGSPSRPPSILSSWTPGASPRKHDHDVATHQGHDTSIADGERSNTRISGFSFRSALRYGDDHDQPTAESQDVGYQAVPGLYAEPGPVEPAAISADVKSRSGSGSSDQTLPVGVGVSKQSSGASSSNIRRPKFTEAWFTSESLLDRTKKRAAQNRDSRAYAPLSGGVEGYDDDQNHDCEGHEVGRSLQQHTTFSQVLPGKRSKPAYSQVDNRDEDDAGSSYSFGSTADRIVANMYDIDLSVIEPLDSPLSPAQKSQHLASSSNNSRIDPLRHHPVAGWGTSVTSAPLADVFDEFRGSEHERDYERPLTSAIPSDARTIRTSPGSRRRRDASTSTYSALSEAANPHSRSRQVSAAVTITEEPVGAVTARSSFYSLNNNTLSSRRHDADYGQSTPIITGNADTANNYNLYVPAAPAPLSTPSSRAAVSATNSPPTLAAAFSRTVTASPTPPSKTVAAKLQNRSTTTSTGSTGSNTPRSAVAYAQYSTKASNTPSATTATSAASAAAAAAAAVIRSAGAAAGKLSAYTTSTSDLRHGNQTPTAPSSPPTSPSKSRALKMKNKAATSGASGRSNNNNDFGADTRARQVSGHDYHLSVGGAGGAGGAGGPRSRVVSGKIAEEGRAGGWMSRPYHGASYGEVDEEQNNESQESEDDETPGENVLAAAQRRNANKRDGVGSGPPMGLVAGRVSKFAKLAAQNGAGTR